MEDLNVCRKDYNKNACNMFKKCYNDQEFTDVTLATADDKQIEAHKIILSSCSPFFENIFLKHPKPNTLIYLKDINYSQLDTLLKFVYLGECHIAQDKLQEFLAIGKELQVEGLLKDIGKGLENLHGKFPMKMKNIEEESVKSNPGKVAEFEGDLTNVKIEFEDFKDATKMSDRYEKLLDANVEDCANANYTCGECNKTFNRLTNLKAHKLSVHEGTKFPCNECDYNATRSDSLKRHMRIIHEGVVYDCSVCGFKAATTGNLRAHEQSSHEGGRYPCDKCEYKATRMDSLKRHIRFVHEGFTYDCDRCEFKTVKTSNLRKHRDSHAAGGQESEKLSKEDETDDQMEDAETDLLQQRTGSVRIRYIEEPDLTLENNSSVEDYGEIQE